MKYLSLLASALLCTQAYSFENEETNMRIVKNAPYFSSWAEFEYKIGEQKMGKTVRTGLLCPRYFYDLYDAENRFQARGITRAFSLGFLYAWGMEIDLYDHEERYVGLIEGKLFTKSRAKYVFYNASGSVVGMTYLDAESSSFLVTRGDNEGTVLAELKGKTYGDLGVWEIKNAQIPDAIDERLMKVFVAFVSDHHSSFLVPPKVIHHHHYNPGRN